MSGGGLAEGDSFPKPLISNAKLRGARPAMREKEFGIWQCRLKGRVALVPPGSLANVGKVIDGRRELV